MASNGSLLIRAVMAMLQGRTLSWATREVKHWREIHAHLTDEELILQCRLALGSPKLPDPDTYHGLSYMRVAGYKLVEGDAAALSLACESFSRTPPNGIAVGTYPYPQQITAAIHLARGALVQMDTGEGKTLALMLATFILLRVHSRVYITTDNPYLAVRDAHTVQPFWSALGVSVGIVLPQAYDNPDWPGWEAQVVYTTPETLIFATMTDDLAAAAADRLVRRAALLMDEVDATLLDGLHGKYTLRRMVAGSSKDWRLACQLAERLTESHIRHSQGAILGAYLTEAGRSEVIRLSGSELSEGRHLSLYHDVELAYTGIRLAIEGRDYEVVDDTIVPINPTNGWRTLSTIPNWVAPLAVHRGLQRQARSMTLHLADGLAAILGFDHFAGTSGTIVNEALEYLLVGSLPTAIVPPRHPRFDGVQPDKFFDSIDSLESHILAEVVPQSPLRPVLIVASSTKDAYRLYGQLRESVASDVQVRFALGDEFGDQGLFEDAGRSGIVVVSTRQAGRGVDIQLTAQARENGGTLLLLVGHASDARLDRQLLGRVGRGGDPFTAYFCCYPDDGFLPESIRAWMTTLRIDQMDSKMPAKAITAAQRARRIRRLQAFANRIAEHQSDQQLFSVFSEERVRAQDAFETSDTINAYITATVEGYLRYHLPASEGAALTALQAREIALRAMTATGTKRLATSLEQRLTGQNSSDAKRIVTTLMVEILNEAAAENAASIESHVAAFNRADSAVELLFLHKAVRKHILRAYIKKLDGSIDCSEHLFRESADTSNIPTVQEPYGVALLRDLITLARSDAGGAILPQPSSLPQGDDTREAIQLLVGAVALARASADVAGLQVMLSRLDEAETVLISQASAYVSRFRTARLVSLRSFEAVVHETLNAVTDLVSEMHSALLFELHQRQFTPFRFQSAYESGISDLVKIAESTMASQLCENAASARDPLQLDALFMARDNNVQVSGPTFSLPSFLVQPTNPMPPLINSDPPAGASASELIEYFWLALQQSGDGRSRPRREELIPALSAVINDAPQPTLADVEGVSEAIARWRLNPIRKRLLPWRRRKVDKAVKQFMSYLHDRGLAARLPSGVRESTLPIRKRLISVLGNPRTQIGMLTMIPIVAAVAGLSVIHIGKAARYAGTARLFDLLLSYGLFGRGALLGIGLAAVTATAMACWLTRGFLNGFGLYPIDRVIMITAAGATSVVTALRVTSNVIVGAGLTLFIFVLSGAVINLFWNMENLSRIRLTSGLLGMSALACGIPAIVESGNHVRLIGCLLLSLAFFANRHIRPPRLLVFSMRWADISAAQSQAVRSYRELQIPVTWLAHGYAMGVAAVAAWATGYAAIVMPVAYAAVYLAWTRRVGNSLTDPVRWNRDLREADQTYASAGVDDTLESRLRTLRRRFVLRDGIVGVVFILSLITLGKNESLLNGGPVPIGLIIGFLTIAGLEWASAAFLSVRYMFGLQRPAGDGHSTEALSETMTSEIRDILERFGKRLAVAAFIYLILAKIAEFLHVVELVRQIIDHVRSLA